MKPTPDARVAPASEQRPRTGEQTRFVAVRARLLPAEVIAARRAHERRRWVFVGLAGLVCLLVAWYGLALFQTSAAKHSLARAQRQTAQLNSQQRQFQPLLTAQQQSATITDDLTRLMAGDLQWKDLLATLRRSAGGGVSISGVNGLINVGAANALQTGTSGGLGVLNQTGKQQVGTLTITGTAADKNSVAAYVDTLAKVRGLTAPLPASLTGSNGKLSFAVNVVITSDALGGRYAPQVIVPTASAATTATTPVVSATRGK
jgi:Tfp pilus assembly protein PilN